MIVVVDERELVKDGYTSLFGREGIPSTGFDPREFGEWVNAAADSDIDAVEAFLIGQGDATFTLPRAYSVARLAELPVPQGERSARPGHMVVQVRMEPSASTSRNMT